MHDNYSKEDFHDDLIKSVIEKLNYNGFLTKLKTTDDNSISYICIRGTDEAFDKLADKWNLSTE